MQSGADTNRCIQIRIVSKSVAVKVRLYSGKVTDGREVSPWCRVDQSSAHCAWVYTWVYGCLATFDYSVALLICADGVF